LSVCAGRALSGTHKRKRGERPSRREGGREGEGGREREREGEKEQQRERERERERSRHQ
jgi:hypothetical protein